MRGVKGLGGDMSSILGDNVFDAPWDMVAAINHALTVLSWFENLPQEEQPPRHIWWSGDLVNEWFDNVRVKRSASSGRKTAYELADDVPMDANSFAEDLRPSG